MSALENLKALSGRADLSQRNQELITLVIEHIEKPDSDVRMSDVDGMLATANNIKKLSWPEDVKKDMLFVAEGLEELSKHYDDFLTSKSRLGR